ncbi:MAG: pyridoxal phosphate-dependent aminotransferase [Phycisphaerales bacterium]
MPNSSSGSTTAPRGAASAFRDLPFMGVIRVNVEAMNYGFRMGAADWANLGQGQPEVGDLDGAPPRLKSIEIDPADHAYGQVEGVDHLREAIANHYNRLYRKGKSSQYTADNVAVSSGGRLALSRVGAALKDVRLGYFTPDYTAYEDLLTTFDRIEPVWIELPASNGFRMSPDDIFARVDRESLGALLISNPCNPTGVVLSGDELKAWVDESRERGTVLLMDEFYSHYVYPQAGVDGPVSTAAFIDDVNEDPVLIFDGLTKCFRYPGWRVGWVVAPKDVIRTLTAAGSFLDGGPCRPMQRLAAQALEPKRADQETDAVRANFKIKRDLTVEKLSELGVEFPCEPQGTFYAFGSVAKLPAPLNTGRGFMRAAFDHRVLTVPGEYFDVNPNRERSGPSPLEPFVRFSYGPPLETLKGGLERLGEMVAKYRK